MDMSLKPGTFVRMSETCKDALIRNDCKQHVDEFGECIGIVRGHAIGPRGEKWPEVDVVWKPSNLVYAYLPERDLVVVNGSNLKHIKNKKQRKRIY